MVLGCVWVSLVVTCGRESTTAGVAQRPPPILEKEKRDGKYEDGVVGGLSSELDSDESVGELPRDGTCVSLGGLP